MRGSGPQNGNEMKRLLMTCVLAVFTGALHAENAPVRVGVLKFGTVNWELDVIQHHGLDADNGVAVQVVPLGSKNATSVALQGGAVDIIVTDWVWVSRQRAEGRKYVFFPYSLTVGALLVHPDAGISRLSDLEGRKLGIAGGPVDKSWLLLQAYARKSQGLDLQQAAQPTFAAPPLLNQLMLQGDLPAVLNYWHYGARLEAAGMRPLIQVTEIMSGLGVDGGVPLLGWVFEEQWAAQNREALIAFLKSSYAAKNILDRSDEEWQRLRPLTKAEDEKTLAALRDSYRLGIPRRFGDQELEAARQVFSLLAREGGRDLVGRSSELTAGTFWMETVPQSLLP